MEPGTIYLNGRRIRRGKQVAACCLNAQVQIRNNPLTTAALESTANGVPTGWLGIVPMGGTEVRLEWAPEKADGAVQIHRSKNRSSSWFAAGDLLAEYPALRVEKGYVRQLAWRIEEAAGVKQFILSLVDQPVVPTKKPPVPKGAKGEPSPKATAPTKGA